MKKLWLLVLLAACGAATASAQSDDYKKNEFFAGYSFNRFTDDGGANANGFNAAYVYNFRRHVGAKADVSGHFRRDSDSVSGTSFSVRSDVYRYLGGVQFKDNSAEKKVKPFAHALAGGGTLRFTSRVGTTNFSDSLTGFAIAVGGGLDIRANDRISVRAGQVDYAPIFRDGATINAVRFSAGIVFH
jgi:hypothetical protein